MQEESTTRSDPLSELRAQRPAAKLSAVELAAQRGIGPLSPLGMKVWHGESFPCVSCGELVRRNQIRCSECGEDLSLKMIMKMQAHAGPWYVHEHIRPFPGVTLERLIRQIQRGVLTPTTIVRGPTTYHQWRFAAETPALSKHLGLCWNCQAKAAPEDSHCSVCRVNLDQPAGLAPGMDLPDDDAPPPPPPVRPTTSAPTRPAEPGPPRSTGPSPATRTAAPAVQAIASDASSATSTPPAPVPARDTAAELARLQEALRTTPAVPPTGKPFPTGIIITIIVLVSVLALMVVVALREQSRAAALPTPTPATVPTPVETTEDH